MSKTGVLLVNLGTPDSPSGQDVHKYLTEFLTDGRVIDTPWLSRQALVRAVIVPRRYKESARSYKAIWTAEGSPLMLYGQKVRDQLQDVLGNDYLVALAMRYQSPSIPSALETLRDCGKLIVVPLFPQYASATTGSIHQKVMETLCTWDTIPELHLINSYPTDPLMIEAMCRPVENCDLSNYDHILFSFHGLPERQIRKADKTGNCLTSGCCSTLCIKNKFCYSAQCHATARAIAARLGLENGHYSLCFQSRLGSDPWLKPYTAEKLTELRQKGAASILVFCPAFVCDCLETLYEIGVEYKHAFIAAGGNTVDLVPCLNDRPEWINALSNLITEKFLTAKTDIH